MNKIMPGKFWTEIFDNGEVVVEQDKDGNYRVSFFEDNHWKDDYVYVKWHNTDEYKQWERAHPSEIEESILKQKQEATKVTNTTVDKE